MKKFTTSILIGIFAGIIDVIPMIVQKLDWYSNASAFFFWVVMGIIIAHVSIKIKSWLKGLVVALISIIPILIIVASSDPKSIMPIIIMTIILGSLIGFLTEKFIK